MTGLTKFSQIGVSANDLSSGDYLLGLQGGTADVLFTRFQVQQGVDKELQGNTAFYVATTGSDTNVGSSTAPWLTLQHAADTVLNFELQGFEAAINIATGSYTGVDLSLKPNLSGIISFYGSSSSPTGVVINPSTTVVKNIFKIEYSLNVNIANLLCAGTGAANAEIGILAAGQNASRQVFSPPSVNLSNVSFSSVGFPIDVEGGADVNISGSWTIGGNVTNAMFIQTGAMVTVSNGTSCVMSSGSAISDAFIRCEDHSLFHIYGRATFTGSGVTGTKFTVSDGAVIQTNSSDVNFFPGSLAGLIDIGGQYDNIMSNSNVYIVANLPPVANVIIGQRAFVTDSTVGLAAGLGNPVVGLGAAFTPVYSDGTTWRIG